MKQHNTNISSHTNINIEDKFQKIKNI